MEPAFLAEAGSRFICRRRAPRFQFRETWMSIGPIQLSEGSRFAPLREGAISALGPGREVEAEAEAA